MARNLKREKLNLQMTVGFMQSWELEVVRSSIDLETRTFTVAVQDGSDGMIVNFCFGNYAESQEPYLRLTGYEDTDFIIESMKFLRVLSYVFDIANIFRDVHYLDNQIYRSTNMLEPVQEMLEFLDQYIACGFPMWNNLSNLKTLLLQTQEWGKQP